MAVIPSGGKGSAILHHRNGNTRAGKGLAVIDVEKPAEKEPDMAGKIGRTVVIPSADSPSPHMQSGRQQKVAVVFSCPGRHEEIAGCPAARTTGKNLDMLLSLLSGALGRSDLARSEITITNAWPTVEYKARTGRSEATARELKAASNLERLQRELAEVTDFVIFCGAKARAVARDLRLERKPRFVYIEHLGSRGLLPIRTDVEGRPIISADDRISAD